VYVCGRNRQRRGVMVRGKLKTGTMRVICCRHKMRLHVTALVEVIGGMAGVRMRCWNARKRAPKIQNGAKARARVQTRGVILPTTVSNEGAVHAALRVQQVRPFRSNRANQQTS